MPRTSRGAITLFDVTDGTNPITAFLTNENHTFPADQGGTVAAATRRMFETEVTVFVGGTLAPYSSTLNVTPGTTGETPNLFRITSVTSADTDWTPAFHDSATDAILDGVLRQPGDVWVSAIPVGADGSTTLTISFVVSNELGTVSSVLTTQATLSVVAQGAGGVVINLDPTSQFYTADSDGTLTPSQTAITVDVLSQGSTGAMTVSTSQNGAGFVTVTTTSTDAGGISGWDDDTDGPFQTGPIGTSIRRLEVDQLNLGVNNTLSVQVTGASGGNDIFTIAKVRTGAMGADAIIVTVNSDTNGAVFRVAGGVVPPAKTLSVLVFDAADGSLIAPADITNYDWFRGDGTTAVRVTSATDRSVIDSGGVEASGAAFTDITVDSTDVENEEAFSCDVTTST